MLDRDYPLSEEEWLRTHPDPGIEEDDSEEEESEPSLGTGTD